MGRGLVLEAIGTISHRVGEENGQQPEGPIDRLQHYVGGAVILVAIVKLLYS